MPNLLDPAPESGYVGIALGSLPLLVMGFEFCYDYITTSWTPLSTKPLRDQVYDEFTVLLKLHKDCIFVSENCRPWVEWLHDHKSSLTDLRNDLDIKLSELTKKKSDHVASHYLSILNDLKSDYKELMHYAERDDYEKSYEFVDKIEKQLNLLKTLKV